MKTFLISAAQGDLLIRKIEKLPKDLKSVQPENGHFVLAHSETGHHHVIDCKNVEVFEPADDEFIAYLELSAPGEIEHLRSYDTHEALSVPEGTYEIRRQREYVPGSHRRAAD